MTKATIIKYEVEMMNIGGKNYIILPKEKFEICENKELFILKEKDAQI